MKTLVITPKNQTEFKFLSDLLKKLGIQSSSVEELEELEDLLDARIAAQRKNDQEISWESAKKELKKAGKL